MQLRNELDQLRTDCQQRFEQAEADRVEATATT